MYFIDFKVQIRIKVQNMLTERDVSKINPIDLISKIMNIAHEIKSSPFDNGQKQIIADEVNQLITDFFQRGMVNVEKYKDDVHKDLISIICPN